MSAADKGALSIDLTIPSTVSQQQNKNNLTFLEAEEEYKRCPKHEKEYAKSKSNGASSPTNKIARPNAFNKVNVMFGKSPLQKKLDLYGIKIKVSMNHKRKIYPTTDESFHERKFSVSELRSFNFSQLEIIAKSMQDEIENLTNELTYLNEEHERHSSDKDGLQMTVRNFEELALRLMKPWVNKMPHSDEMTRVMLLN